MFTSSTIVFFKKKNSEPATSKLMFLFDNKALSQGKVVWWHFSDIVNIKSALMNAPGGTLNVEVIGMLVGNFFGKP